MAYRSRQHEKHLHRRARRIARQTSELSKLGGYTKVRTVAPIALNIAA